MPDSEEEVTIVDGVTVRYSTRGSEEERTREDGSIAEDEDEPVYTVDEAVEQMGFGLFQLIITVFSGLVWIADAIEILVLSVLSPAVKCEWGLSSTEEALITSLVFVGNVLASIVWGPMADRYGRKRVLWISTSGVLLFGILSAVPVSPHKEVGYPWLLLCRMAVGASVGGSVHSVTYYVEFLPKKARALCIILLEVFWALGGMFGAVLALVVLPRLNWHWYLGLSAFPLMLVMFLYLIVPESPRFYLVHGKQHKAQKVMELIAWYNRKPLPMGKVVSLEEKEKLKEQSQHTASVDSVTELELEEEDVTGAELNNMAAAVEEEEREEEREGEREEGPSPPPDPVPESVDERQQLLVDSELEGKEDSSTRKPDQNQFTIVWIFTRKQVGVYASLFTNGVWRLTVPLVTIWFGCASIYYGVILLTTTLLQYDAHCGIHGDNATNSTECEELTTNDYLRIMWTSAAEFPGILLTLIAIDYVGRKKTMIAGFLLTTGAYLLLFICTTPLVLTLFLFIIRALIAGVFQAVYVYTPEAYPTIIRGSALGLPYTASRLGAAITPFGAQVLLHVSEYLTISLYTGMSLLLAILAAILPLETKGRPLKDIHLDIKS